MIIFFFIAHTLLGCGISFLIQPVWYGFPHGELKICLPLPSKVLEVVLEARLCGKLHVFPWYGLFGKRKMQVFLRTKKERKGKCGTYFTSLPLCGLHVPLYLKQCHFHFYNLIVGRFVFNYPNKVRMCLGNTCWLGF